MPSRDLRDAVVVITGASSGIGRAAAVAFASHGARLALAARDPGPLAEVARECEERGATAMAAPTDIAETEGPDALADQALGAFGRIDVWVECASLLIAGRLEDTPADEVRGLIDTNVTGSALGARAALRAFDSQGSGTLIMVSSLLGVLPAPLSPVYAMSKFATRGLALSLRVASRPGIDVCAVLPPGVDTPVYQRAANHTGRQLRAIPPAHAPERVAAAIVGCARRPRRQATTGASARALLLAHHMAPRPTEWLVGEWSARLLTRPAPVAESAGAVAGPGPAGAPTGGWRRGRLRRRAGERVGAWMASRGA